MQSLFRRFVQRMALFGFAFSLVPVSVWGFSDVTSQTKYRTAIESLEARGVIQGYSDGRYQPLARINRAEFLKIVLESRDVAITADGGCFPDVDEEWFARYVCQAKEEGIVAGYPNGLFKPEQDVNFAEASKILSLAFRQQPQTGGAEWFEPYVRALESSKAIPPTIARLDVPLTRGEMAEMMWRLIEGKTDQESKGFLNVKYPELSVNFASDDVQRARSCADLGALSEQAQTSTRYFGRGMMEDTVGAPAPTMADSKSAELGGGADGGYSQTNLQVEGVDEADIVKTNGTHLFIVRGQTVRIVRATPAVSMREESVIDLAKVDLNPTDLYVDGSTLIVLGQRWMPVILPMGSRMMYPWPGPSGRIEARIYDISHPTSPELKRTVSFEGSMISSRRVDDRLYLVVQQPTRWYPGPRPLDESTLLPQFRDSSEGDDDMPITRCGNVSILPHVISPSYITVAVVPTDDENAAVTTEVIVGNGENVYMSLDNLYIATTEWNYVWDAVRPESSEKTNVFRFALENDGATFAAKGTVSGRILNQFSMDEHGSSFRIATTSGNTWDGKSRNNLYILNRDMERVGAIEDIAPGESIYSVRFLGDRAYMVTFQKIDPFFVIDTSDPRNPKILGKLKIPGYSDYLHPYDATHVIGVGKEAVAAKEGDFAWYQGMKLALFDVSDVSDPKELHRITIGDRGTESPLLHNHKALLFDKSRNLLAFPITVAKIPDSMKKGDEPSAYGSPVFQGAHVYTLTLKDGFKLRGAMTHYPAGTFEKAGDYWYGGGSDVERIVRIGESLYTTSQWGVMSHDENDVELEGKLEFDEE